MPSSNPPEGRLHVVLMNTPNGAVLCSADDKDNRAAIFLDPGNAAIRCQRLRDKNPGVQFQVLPAELLP